MVALAVELQSITQPRRPSDTIAGATPRLLTAQPAFQLLYLR